MFSATVNDCRAAPISRDAIRVETISAEEQHQDITYRAVLRPSDRQNAIINLLLSMMIKRL